MLRGEHGTIVQKSMKIIVTLGDIFGAKRLGRIASVHISGISYLNIGESGLDFLEEWASEGAVARVLTTINPCGMDVERWRELGVSEAFVAKQMRIVEAFKRMKVARSLSCTPYIIGNKPAMGEHVAWAESSAIAYANSVLGARTNREGGPTALASAITGRTPMFGYHLDEERKPTHELHLSEYIKGALECSALGYYVGEKIGESIPLFKGLNNPSLEELKALSAGLAASGAIALYHILDFTPEEKNFRGESFEKVDVGKRELAETVEKLSMRESYDHVCIGCPHCSLREIAEIAKKVAGKTLRRKLWVFTSSIVCDEAKRRGYVEAIERVGGRVISDTCMVVAPMREMGVEGMLTNSCKAAHYAPSTCKVPVTLNSLNECVEAALG